jgi:hypothetical protein
MEAAGISCHGRVSSSYDLLFRRFLTRRFRSGPRHSRFPSKWTFNSPRVDCKRLQPYVKCFVYLHSKRQNAFCNMVATERLQATAAYSIKRDTKIVYRFLLCSFPQNNSTTQLERRCYFFFRKTDTLCCLGFARWHSSCIIIYEGDYPEQVARKWEI